MSLSLEEIARDADRSWTLRLLDALRQDDCPGLGELAWCFAQLDDPRVEPALLRLLLDRSQPGAVRERVSLLVGEPLPRAAGEDARAWWARADHWERRAALRTSTRRESDILVEIAADPAHPLYLDALATMWSGFDEPRFQRLVIAALASGHTEARDVAGFASLGTRPIAAEPLLIAASHAADPAVAVPAVGILGCYRSRAAFRRLDACCEHELAAVRTAAFDATLMVAGWDLCLDEAVRARVDAWLGSARDFLARRHPLDEQSAEAPACALVRPPVRQQRTVDAIIADYRDADGHWRAKLSAFPDAESVIADADGRERLAGYFAAHDDAAVRARACELLVQWARTADLQGLLGDRERSVRVAAAKAVVRASPQPSFVAPLRACITGPLELHGDSAAAVLAFAVHGGDAAAGELVRLVRDDARDSVRVAAVEGLASIGATAALADLLALLREAPALGWALHVALLRAAERLGVDVPAAAALADIDDLDVQIALAQLDHSSGVRTSVS